LPAFIELPEAEVAGIKWISSFPGNVAHEIPRASAVLILNDYTTGYPIALLEAASISAARTAASAAVAARAIARHVPADGQVALNISLRDFQPSAILGAENYFDDVEHCMKADTSPHLCEQATGGRDFVTGTIADILKGRNLPTGRRGVVFSPFGLGVLDLAV